VTSPVTAFTRALLRPGPLRAVELRPPPAPSNPADAGQARASMEAWIDTFHGMGRLLAADRFVLFTDDAVGSREEESLAHLAANLGPQADLSRIVPFLTCKHTLATCLLFSRRAAARGVGGITVTGGDATVGPPRCVPRASDLRVRIREAGVGLPLGGWANPFRDAEEQVAWLLEAPEPTDWVLTQVVSHHDPAPVDCFLEVAARRGLTLPLVFGVFHYRSANPRTLARLGHFLPVPAAGVTRELKEEGIRPEEATARTLRMLRDRGVEKVYLSNLAVGSAARTLARIEACMEEGV
jgi:hypothetical protein